MKNIPSFENFITEKALNESLLVPKSIIAKKGDKLWRLMTRYNPQLGTYYVFNEVTVTRVNAKSISCSDNAVYNSIDGFRKSKTESGYGSADYQIMTKEEAEIAEKEIELRTGKKPRGLSN